MKNNISKQKEQNSARPFIQWVGGKRKLSEKILNMIPLDFNNYHEPFVGGGAVYFAMKDKFPNKMCVISDLNSELIIAYEQVKNNPKLVYDTIQSFPYNREFYHILRDGSENVSNKLNHFIAARFIYLNKTGFNGLYRVNSKNLFNVPFGTYSPNKVICDGIKLNKCSEILNNNTSIIYNDFISNFDLGDYKEKDLIYIDPPIPSHFKDFKFCRIHPTKI